MVIPLRPSLQRQKSRVASAIPESNTSTRLVCKDAINLSILFFLTKKYSVLFQYGGNPVSCAVANAVMEVIEREGLQENALKVGNHLLAELKKLAKRRRIIGDVRGAGLFVGIELVRDRIKRIPATAEAKHVVSRMKEKKILVSSDGPDNNVLKLKPPMVFTLENANHFVSVLDEVLEEVDIDFDEVIRILHLDTSNYSYLYQNKV